MSYTKTNWATGDTITAEKLNNIENGVANTGGVLVVHTTFNGNSMVLDKTWQEIHDADVAVLSYQTGTTAKHNAYLSTIDYDGDYTCTFINDDMHLEFMCTGPDSYPQEI